MKLYHGSKNIVERPVVKGSNQSNDYGPAFYLTVDLESAKSWACKNNSLGVVNVYGLNSKDFNEFKILDLTNKEQYSVLNWIAILMHFRTLDVAFKRNNELVLKWLEKFYIDVDEYDVIIGFRADDAYFRFPIRFISNDLSFDDLERVFLSGHLGVQYAFISEKAIKSLEFKETIKCEPSFLGHYYSIISSASKAFNEVLNVTRDPKKTYILDLMRMDDDK